MNYWGFPNSSNKKRFDIFLEFTGRDIFTDAGAVSKITAKAYTETEFEKYRVTQDKLYQSDFDKLVVEIY